MEVILVEKYAGLRLDKALAELFSDFSRSFLQNSMKNGYILVDGRIPRSRDIVAGGERVVFDIDAAVNDKTDEVVAEDITLDVVYEDEDILVINKPAGMVVHPAAGHLKHTLVNALIHRRPDLKRLPRAGIIHRLDKDTSGLLVIAGNHTAHHRLVEQMRKREITREYLCLVSGQVISGGVVNAVLGRDFRDRKRMAVVHNGKSAVTHYWVKQRFKQHTLLKIQLETGRTHQIRVHMLHIHYPVFGDPVYGGRLRVPANASPELLSAASNFKRQALHANKLGLTHPISLKPYVWQSDLPEDLRHLISLFSENSSQT